jgi:uncharacterized protein (DUF58 family)
MAQYTWLLLILLAIAFFLQVDFIFYILYVFVGVLLWSRFYTPRAMRRLMAGRDYNRRAFLGEIVPVRLAIHNQGRFSIPWLQFDESVPPELRLEESVHQVVTLRGRETYQVTYHVRGSQRGYYQLGPLRLSSGDLFGLSAAYFGYLAADHLTIYPRIIPLTQLGLPSRLPFGTVASRQRLFEDPARPMGVRNFQHGDSLRQMNWKVCAHARQLFVKTFEPAISLETVILLNLHDEDYERSDRAYTVEWAIIVAASLASHLVNQRQAVGLITNGVDPLRAQALHDRGDEPDFDETSGRLLYRRNRSHSEDDRERAVRWIPPALPPRNGRSHLMKILEQLARIETDHTISFAAWATAACVSLSWGVTILAITARGDEPTCNTLHRLVRAGFNPILLATEPDYNFDSARERARRLGFRAYKVSAVRDLDRWRQPGIEVSV